MKFASHLLVVVSLAGLAGAQTPPAADIGDGSREEADSRVASIAHAIWVEYHEGRNPEGTAMPEVRARKAQALRLERERTLLLALRDALWAENSIAAIDEATRLIQEEKRLPALPAGVASILPPPEEMESDEAAHVVNALAEYKTAGAWRSMLAESLPPLPKEVGAWKQQFAPVVVGDTHATTYGVDGDEIEVQRERTEDADSVLAAIQEEMESVQRHNEKEQVRAVAAEALDLWDVEVREDATGGTWRLVVRKSLGGDRVVAGLWARSNVWVRLVAGSMETARFESFALPFLSMMSGPWNPAKEAPAIEGTWKATKHSGQGESAAWEWTFLADGKFAIVAREGDQVCFRAEGTYTTDVSITPCRIILHVTKDDSRTVSNDYHGAFRLDAGTLLLKHDRDHNPDAPRYPENLDAEEGWEWFEMTRAQ